MTVLPVVSRNRPWPRPPTGAASVPHAEFAAELLTLPSGLLAMVCEAIVKLKVRLGAARACVRGRVCTVPVRMGEREGRQGGSARLYVVGP